jgi:hypothetical protein
VSAHRRQGVHAQESQMITAKRCRVVHSNDLRRSEGKANCVHRPDSHDPTRRRHPDGHTTTSRACRRALMNSPPPCRQRPRWPLLCRATVEQGASSRAALSGAPRRSASETHGEHRRISHHGVGKLISPAAAFVWLGGYMQPSDRAIDWVRFVDRCRSCVLRSWPLCRSCSPDAVASSTNVPHPSRQNWWHAPAAPRRQFNRRLQK